MTQPEINTNETGAFSRFEQLRSRLDDPVYTADRASLADLVREIGKANTEDVGFIITTTGTRIDTESIALAIEQGRGEEVADETIARAATRVYMQEGILELENNL
jgi:hypothetical protein